MLKLYTTPINSTVKDVEIRTLLFFHFFSSLFSLLIFFYSFKVDNYCSLFSNYNSQDYATFLLYLIGFSVHNHYFAMPSVLIVYPTVGWILV